ncbi:MAG: hypothetical protein ABUL62_30240 [Myxococcales bacterium]
MTKVDFWGLQRSIQERFVASTQGAAAPAPLAVRPLARDTRILSYFALGVCGVVGAFIALRIGFGDLNSRYALAPVWCVAVYGGLFALAAFGFFKAAARYVTAYAVPFRPALYLFPIGVIDARAPQLAVYRITEETQAHVDSARRSLRIDVGGSHFEFPAGDVERAQQAASAIIELRDRLANAGPDSSTREQSQVDPLIDNGFKNPFAPTESIRKALPFWLKIWPLLALGFGVLLGGAAFLIRNHLSEARLYAAARSADQTDTYRTYLARGGKNPDVEALLLPRTELRDAVQQGGVSAIEQFIAQHPNTEIQPEADAALQQALLKELSVAQASGTLSALKAYAAQYSRYAFLAPNIERAINARIEATLQQLKPSLAPNQSKLLPFMERLLRYTAKHGPEVQVRFQRKPTETLETAEKSLRLSAYFSGAKTLPGQYFDEAHQTPREAAAAAYVTAALNDHFPRDLVDAKAGPALDAAADPKPTVPTVLVTYHTELSGAFTSRRPRFAMSGIGLISKVSFEIPADSEGLAFKLTVWRAPDLNSLTDSSTPADLYETMAGEAFKRFMKKYLATLFVEKP